MIEEKDIGNLTGHRPLMKKCKHCSKDTLNIIEEKPLCDERCHSAYMRNLRWYS